MQLENKFLVLKWDDINKALKGRDKASFNACIAKIIHYRIGQGKHINTYVVVNMDESYAQEVVKLIEDNQ